MKIEGMGYREVSAVEAAKEIISVELQEHSDEEDEKKESFLNFSQNEER